jgi:hypothetical protein
MLESILSKDQGSLDAHLAPLARQQLPMLGQVAHLPARDGQQQQQQQLLPGQLQLRRLAAAADSAGGGNLFHVMQQQQMQQQHEPINGTLPAPPPPLEGRSRRMRWACRLL